VSAGLGGLTGLKADPGDDALERAGAGLEPAR